MKKTIQEQALELCYAIEEAGASEQLTKCSELASALRERVQKAEGALTEIAHYDGESIWSDDRDNAANDMLRIARAAIGEERPRK